MLPKISIIMSVYKEPIEWVELSINSILEQTYSNIELIIICDNPQDRHLVCYLLRKKKSDHRVILHINESNKGLIYSLNKAISLTSGTYIARMDADDISLSSRLENQMAFLEKEELDLCGCNALLFSEKGIIGKTNKLEKHKFIEKLMWYGDIGIIHPTFFGKREVFIKSGGYNKKAIHAEDMEFIAHILTLGYKVGNLSKYLLKYRFSENSITRKNAFSLYTTISCIKKSYRKFKKSEKYFFENKIINNPKKEINYTKNKIYLTKSREAINSKRFLIVIYFLVLAIIKSPILFYHSIKILIINKLLKRMESN
ncbi:glycosyltransferase [Rodentibacter pneumotropicus]|nr:glycosyltransferase [Rodentibacter pneumotropicus]OOF62156.1 glycosyltransferase [Rodentibacter pneumotropicus]